MASLQFDIFNLAKDKWNSWSHCFKQWLLLIPFSEGESAEAIETKKQAALCMHVGMPTCKLLYFICAPNKPKENTYSNLKEKLDKQYSVKSSSS